MSGLNEVQLESIAERYWAKVDVRGVDECWLWTGSVDAYGYGKISSPLGRGASPLRAHRVAFQLSGRALRLGEGVCHHCDNTGCQNPRHLFAGDQAANIQDAVRKGRLPTPNSLANLKSSL